MDRDAAERPRLWKNPPLPLPLEEQASRLTRLPLFRIQHDQQRARDVATAS